MTSRMTAVGLGTLLALLWGAGCHLAANLDELNVNEGSGGSAGSGAQAGSGGSGGSGAQAGGMGGGGGMGGSGASGGNGGAGGGCDPAMCAGMSSACTGYECDAQQQCIGTDYPLGTPCSANGNGGSCDGNGTCVLPGCIVNGMLDGDETDIDCGGSCAVNPQGKCANNLMCMLPADCQSNVCTQGKCVPCTAHTQCPANLFCNDQGICEDEKAQGASCNETEECQSGFCVDGVCCDAACDQACESCLQTMTGLNDGLCDAIALPDVICRAAAGPCDFEELCDSNNPTCPNDLFAPVATVCRASAGICDVPETCTGSAADCPADALFGAATTCRAAVGACDQAEQCDGSNPDCPADAFLPNNTVCRAAVAECDVAEVCDGTDKSCPADMYHPDGYDPMACNGYLCDGSMASCATSCLTEADCATGYVCNPGQMCVAKVGNGQLCSGNQFCVTGHCVDGVCCDTACDGVCEACNGALTMQLSGVCSLIPQFTDPDDECVNTGKSCCDGAGMCIDSASCI